MNHYQKISLLILLTLFGTLPSFAADWGLIYSITSAGEATGNKDALIKAVRAGQQIRVGWGVSWELPDGQKTGVEHVADSKFLTIFQGEVFAQIDSILPQRPRTSEKAILFNSPNGETWTGMLDTSGKLHSFHSSQDEPKTQPMASFWYLEGVEKPLPTPKKLN